MKFSLTLNSLYEEKANIKEEGYGIESLIDSNLLSLDMSEYKSCVESIHMELDITKEFDVGTEALTVKGKLVKFWYKVLDIVEKLFGYISSGFKFLLKKFKNVEDYSSTKISNAPIRAYHALINELFKKDEFESEEDAVNFASNLISKSKILSKLTQEHKDMIIEDVRSNYDSSSGKIKEEFEGRVEIYYPDEKLRKNIREVYEERPRNNEYISWSSYNTLISKYIPKEDNPKLIDHRIIDECYAAYTNRLAFLCNIILGIKSISDIKRNRVETNTFTIKIISNNIDKLNTELDNSYKSEYGMVKEIFKFRCYRDGIIDSSYEYNDRKLDLTGVAEVLQWINKEFIDVVKIAEDIHKSIKDLKRKSNINKYDNDGYVSNKYREINEVLKTIPNVSSRLISTSKKVFSKIGGDLLKKLSIGGLTLNYITTYKKRKEWGL